MTINLRQMAEDEEICVRILAENKKIDYIPDWDNMDEYKIFIQYSHFYKKYSLCANSELKSLGTTYTTEEIAKQIVTELNEKRFERVSE